MLASIPSPPDNSLELGPLDIHAYGVLIAIGVAVAFSIARRRYEARGGDADLIDRVMLWSVVLGFLGARLAYVSTRLDQYADRPWAILFIWEGGLALFGGLTIGSLTAILLLRRWGGDVPAFADSAAIAVPLAQAIGRWGNYFNQELFGTPTDLPWAVEIDPAIAAARGFPGVATFHPTFLYESLYNLVVVGLLLWIERRRQLRPGSLFAGYLILYGVGRFLLELIRTDTEFRLLGLSRNAWVALIISIGGTIWIARREGGHVPPDEDEPGAAATPEGSSDPTLETPSGG